MPAPGPAAPASRPPRCTPTTRALTAGRRPPACPARWNGREPPSWTASCMWSAAAPAPAPHRGARSGPRWTPCTGMTQPTTPGPASRTTRSSPARRRARGSTARSSAPAATRTRSTGLPRPTCTTRRRTAGPRAPTCPSTTSRWPTPAGFSLAPGRSVTVTVSLDSARLDQPGTYAATLWAAASDPYPVQMAAVAMHVTPPRGWALVHGTVTGPGGQLAPGATIALSRFTGTAPGLRQTLPGGVAAGPAPATAAVKTNADGAYQWWLSGGYAPLLVSAARDGYQPQARIVTGWPRARGAVGFALPADPGSPVYHPAPGPAARPARHGARPAGRAVRPAAAGSAGALGPALARLAAGDVKRVCAAPKRGFASCMSLLRTNVPAHRGLFGHDTAPSGYGPPDLQSAYSLPSATAGGGQTVAIVDAYDDPNAAADLATYRAQFGLPAYTTASGCFEKVNQEGQQGSYPAPDAGWATEESLDVDMVSAVCPSCHIILVEANSSNDTDMYAAEDEAVALGAKYVSNSWTSSEYSGETQADQYFNHPGVVITAAAGDSGYGVNYPAASPYVTAVGGTTLTKDSGVPRGWTETAWGSASGGEGTGSGCSQYEPKPAWQHNSGCANRTVADVSAVADPNTGVAMYDSYSQSGWLVVGGTSVATPVIASTYALAGAPEQGTNPASYPYLHSTGLNDVTSGADGTCTPSYLCTAGPGYDGPTGLGTPDGVTAFQPGGAGTGAGTVAAAAPGKPVAGAEVDAGGFSASTNASGQYALT